jgi:hypothetical protein
MQQPVAPAPARDVAYRPFARRAELAIAATNDRLFDVDLLEDAVTRRPVAMEYLPIISLIRNTYNQFWRKELKKRSRCRPTPCVTFLSTRSA